MSVTLNTMMRNNYNTYKLNSRTSSSSDEATLNMLNSLNSSSSSSSESASLLNSVLGGSSSSDSSSSSMYDIAADYTTYTKNQRSIHSYLKSQYASGTSASSASSEVSGTTKTADSSDTAASTSKVDTAADKLVKSANALTDTGDDSLFKADENGDYDMDAIASAVSGFVDNYNSLKTAVTDSGSTDEVSAELDMVNNTKVFSKALNQVGITLNSDNTMSLDTEALKSADVDTVKAVFNGNASYASSVAAEAEQVKDTSSASSSFSFSGYDGTGTTGSYINMLV